MAFDTILGAVMGSSDVLLSLHQPDSLGLFEQSVGLWFWSGSGGRDFMGNCPSRPAKVAKLMRRRILKQPLQAIGE